MVRFGIRKFITVQIYERLVVISQNYPIGGNKHGSYLTGWSLGSLEINLINVSEFAFLWLLLCRVSITQPSQLLKGTLGTLSIGFSIIGALRYACH